MSLNLPNALAFLRVFLAPLMFWLLLSVNSFSGVHVSWMNYFAALVFVIASVTDFFDGFIARAWDQKTKLGAVIDPLADKMLTLGTFLGLMMIDRANPWGRVSHSCSRVFYHGISRRDGGRRDRGRRIYGGQGQNRLPDDRDRLFNHAVAFWRVFALA